MSKEGQLSFKLTLRDNFFNMNYIDGAVELGSWKVTGSFAFQSRSQDWPFTPPPQAKGNFLEQGYPPGRSFIRDEFIDFKPRTSARVVFFSVYSSYTTKLTDFISGIQRKIVSGKVK